MRVRFHTCTSPPDIITPRDSSFPSPKVPGFTYNGLCCKSITLKHHHLHRSRTMSKPHPPRTPARPRTREESPDPLSSPLAPSICMLRYVFLWKLR
jgi:hypothetical protein